MPKVEIVHSYSSEPGAGRRQPADAAEARARLEAGNDAFAGLLEALNAPDDSVRRLELPLDPRDVGVGLGPLDAAPPQRPFAAILGCSDARVPCEMLFDEGPNDLFVVRVAGNVLGQEVVGSLRYAASHLPLRCVVVLGHSGCGAVSAAVDAFLEPAGILALATDHAQRTLLSRIVLIVQAAARGMRQVHGAAVEDKPGYRAALVEMTVALNAATAAHSIASDFATSGEDGSGIPAYHGVYVIGSRRVCVADPDLGERPGLGLAPASREEFVSAFHALAASPRIAALLEIGA